MQGPKASRFNKQAWFALLILFWVAVIYVLTIRVTDMHSDEFLVYRQTRFDLAYTFDYQTTQDVHPPLWFSFFWGWRQLVGESEFAGRMQAIFFSMIALALTYRIGAEWFGKRRYGLAAMALLGVSAYHVAYAVEIRPYALTMLLATVSMFVFGRWVRRRKAGSALLWGEIVGAALYVHYFTAFLAIAQGVYALIVVRPWRRLIAHVALALLAVWVVWGRWLPVIYHQLVTVRQVAADASQAYPTGLGTPHTATQTSLDAVWQLILVMTNGAWPLYAGLIVLSVALLWRRRMFWLAFAWGFGVPLVTLIINLLAAVYSPRYIAYLTPGLALTAGAGLASLPGRWRGTLGAAAVVALGLGLPAALPDRPPLREIYQTMGDDAQAGDLVLIGSGTFVDDLTQWQIEHHLAPDLQVAITEDTQHAQSARRVWFVTDNWFDEDVQRQFGALEQTHPLQTVLGDCNIRWCYLVQLMEGPPEYEALMFGDQIGFYGFDVDRVEDDRVEVRLWWRADEDAPLLDYAIGLYLLDASGALVAQADGPINHYDNEIVPTSQMQPGQIYIDYRALDLPADLPPGDYTLELAIYQPWDGVRLTLPGGADLLALDMLTLPPN